MADTDQDEQGSLGKGSPGRTPSVSEYGHGRHQGRGPCAELAPDVPKDTWHLRQWLVVEVLIGILEFHDIAIEGDVDREVLDFWYSDRGHCSDELKALKTGSPSDSNICPSKQ